MRLFNQDPNDDVAIDGVGGDNLVAMNSTPAWNINQRAWISAGHLEKIPGHQFFDPVLGSNNRQGAEQSASIKVETVFRHASYQALHRRPVA